MPVTVYHSLTATTPDNTAYEIKPSNWNSKHVASVSMVGSEVVGAFSNGGNVSFGLNSNGYITATVSGSQSIQTQNSVLVQSSSGNIVFGSSGSANVFFGGINGTITASFSQSVQPAVSTLQLQGSTGTVVFSNSNNVSFGGTNSVITASVAPPITFSASGTQGTSSGTNQILLAAGNNITFSGTTNASGNMTIAIHATTGGGAGGGVGAIGVNGSNTFSTGTVQFQNSNNVTFGTTTNTLGNQVITASASQSVQSISVTGNLSYSLNSNTINLGVPYQTLGISGTNSSGINFTNSAPPQFVLAGGNNVTLSGSTNSLGMTVTVSGPTVGGLQSFYAAGSNGTYAFSTLIHTNSNNISFYTTTTGGSSAIAASYAFNVSAGTTSSNVNALNFTSSGAGNIAFGMSSNSLTASYSQTNQSVGLYAAGNTIGSSSSTYDARSLSVSGAGIVSVGASAGSGIVISATQSNQVFSAFNGSSTFQTLYFASALVNGLQFSNSNGTIVASYTVPSTTGLISGINVTAQGSTTNASAISFANSNNVTFGLSGGTVTASASFSSAGGGAFPGVSNLGNTAGTTGFATAGNFVLVGTNGISLSQSLATNSSGGTLTINAPASSLIAGSGAVTVATTGSTVNIGAIPHSGGMSNLGNTSGVSGMATNQLVLVGGNNITLSGSTNGGSATVSIIGSVSTVSGVANTLNFWEPAPMAVTATGTLSQNVPYVAPLYPPNNVSFSSVQFVTYINPIITRASAWSVGTTLNYGLYQQDIGTNSSQFTLMSSSSMLFSQSGSGATTGGATINTYGYTLAQGTNSTASSFQFAAAVSGLSGAKILNLPFTGSMAANGTYFLGVQMSSVTSGVTANLVGSMLFVQPFSQSASALGVIAPNYISSSSANNRLKQLGFNLATSTALPGTVAYTAIQQNAASGNKHYVIFGVTP